MHEHTCQWDGLFACEGDTFSDDKKKERREEYIELQEEEGEFFEKTRSIDVRWAGFGGAKNTAK